MQLGLISTSTLDVVIETSLVTPVETKQVRKVDLNWKCFSVHTRTERYDIVSFQFLVQFSVPPNFWTCFGTDRLIFPYPCEHNPSPYHFLERTEVERYDFVSVWTGTQEALAGETKRLYVSTIRYARVFCRKPPLCALGLWPNDKTFVWQKYYGQNLYTQERDFCLFCFTDVEICTLNILKQVRIRSRTKKFCFTDVETNKCFTKHCFIV